MTVAVIVPLSLKGSAHRERGWDWVQARYAERFPDWEIVVGLCDGEWSKGAAVADALEHTDADTLLIADADVWSENVLAAVDAVVNGRAWSMPHHYVIRFYEQATARIVNGENPAVLATQARCVSESHRAMIGGGLIAIQRHVYEACPLDPRFEGWGGEDEAWGVALTTLHGRRHTLDGPLWHLWHEPAQRLNRKVGNVENDALKTRYRMAGGNVDVTRALIEEGRLWASSRSSSPQQPSRTRSPERTVTATS